MPMYDHKYLLTEAEAFTTDAYTTDVDDIKFPSTNPNAGRAGKLGMHWVVTTAFTGLDSGVILWAVHGAATAPTTKLIGRFVAVADMVAGAHFYVPMPPSNLQFVRGWFDAVSEAATAGALTVWIGPDEDGTI